MPDIDNLSIKIKADSDIANKALSDLIANLGKMTSALQNVGKNINFGDITKNATALSQSMDNVQKNIGNMAKNATNQLSSVSKAFSGLEKNFDIGKNINPDVFNDLKMGSQSVADSMRNAVQGISGLSDAAENSLQKQINSFEKQNAAYKNQALKIDELKGKITQLSDVKVETPEYKEISKDMEKMQSQLNRLVATQERFLETGGKETSTGYQRRQLQIEELRNGIKAYADDLKNLESGGEAFTQVDTSKLTQKLNSEVEKLELMGKSLQTTFEGVSTKISQSLDNSSINKSTGNLLNFYDKLSRLKPTISLKGLNLKELESSLNSEKAKLYKYKAEFENALKLGKITASVDDSGYLKMSEKIAVAEKNVSALQKRIMLLKVPKSIANGFTKIGTSITKLFSKISKLSGVFKKLGGSGKSINSSFAGGFKNLLKYSLGIRSLYTLFNKLRNAVKEGMKNLVQYSDETNASVSMLKNSMTQLKNSVAAAAAPLLNVLAPALDFIVQMCIKAVNAINQLISALLGKATWIHAKKLTDSYRDSLNGASKAAEKLQKGVRAFDELNLITTPDDNDGGSGAGTAATDMFETLDVEKPFSDLADKIKEMWKNADFTELGAMVGNKLKDALDGIDWEPIKGVAAKIGKSIATFINGFVEVEGLGYSIGRTIAEAFNTGLTLVNSFLDNTHWDSVGKFIGDGLNGIVDTIDWGGIGHAFAQKWNAIFEVIGNIATTFDWKNFGLSLAKSVNTFIDDFDWAENGARLSDFAKGLLDTIITFLEEVNWQELGEKVAEFIKNIDWSGLADRLFEAIGAAIGGLGAFLWGLIKDEWQKVVDEWHEIMDGDGFFLIEGLKHGLAHWTDFFTWIKEHIFQPFIDGFKKAFGIASPSKVMEEQGNFIMEGLFNGISALVDKVVGIFGDIKTKISEKWNEIKTNTTQTWDSIKSTVSGKWDELKTKASTTWSNIGTTISNKWNEVKTNTSQAWSNVSSWTAGAWSNINSIISSAAGNAANYVSSAWSYLSDVTSNIWNGIKDTISNVASSISNIASGIADRIGQVRDGINNAVGSVSNLGAAAASFLTGGVAARIGSFASGGFIENPHSYSLFMAGENGIPEMLGTVGGQPAVAGGQEITGISDTIRSETERQNELLRQQNQLLQALLQKDFGITKDEIGQAARDYSREYFDKNGKPAFAY